MATDWNIYLLGVLSRVTVSHNEGLRGGGGIADSMKQVP